MSDRLPWFRCFPSALLGALAGLDPDEGLVYVITLLRIYETGGPVTETARTLARRTGLTERRAGAALERLLEAQKVMLTGDGRLDSASTHLEIEWQRERHKDQSAAGRASAAKRAEKHADGAGMRRAEKTQRNQQNGATAVGGAFNQEEEDRDQEGDEPLPDARGARSHSDFPPNAFDRWYETWPNKVGKDAARRKFETIRKSGKVTFAELMAGVQRYIATKPPQRDWCNPATFLNQGRWEDAPAAAEPRSIHFNGRQPSAQQRAMEIARQANLELMGDPDDPGPFADDATARSADGGYQNGHARPGFHEPAGGGFRLAPPRLAGPPRPH